MKAWLERHSIGLLRITLGIIFLWFGILKVIGQSPVSHLISATTYWFEPDKVVLLLGYVEILIGIGFLFVKLLPFTFPIFLVQMAGTFFTFVIRPDITFQSGNIFLLSQEGEFVLKNLILSTAGLAVFAHSKG